MYANIGLIECLVYGSTNSIEFSLLIIFVGKVEAADKYSIASSIPLLFLGINSLVGFSFTLAFIFVGFKPPGGCG